VDVPNQKEERELFMRGWCYNRQVFAREYEPFEWKPIVKLKQRFEEPLEQIAIQTAKQKALQAVAALQAPEGKGAKAAPVQANLATLPRKRIMLLYKRDDEVAEISDSEQFLKEQNRVRKILIGSCKMMDSKLEKNGTYELVSLGKEEKFFDCDIPKGNVNSGQEIVVKFTFKPPPVDPLLKEIKALKGIGQWVESKWELKLQGGWAEPGVPDI